MARIINITIQMEFMYFLLLQHEMVNLNTKVSGRLWPTTIFWPINNSSQSDARADKSEQSDWLVKRMGQFMAGQKHQSRLITHCKN